MGILLGGHLRGEGVREGGAHRNESDRGEAVAAGAEHAAAQQARHVADDSLHNADQHERRHEANPAVHEVRRGHEGAEEFPRYIDGMEDVVADANGLVLVHLAAVHQERRPELVAPVRGAQRGAVPIYTEVAHHLVDALLGRHVRDDCHISDAAILASVAGGVKGGAAGRILDDHAELLRKLVPPLGLDQHLHGRGHLSRLEHHLLVQWLEIQVLDGGDFLRRDLARHSPAAATLPLHLDRQLQVCD
mmetsp:Transcript_85483/g.246752  ORF Transcript_85483/g.246752 Transcript_85483/m.246752 type:complete len:247 (+) Transcript_85483:365-1105(+)